VARMVGVEARCGETGSRSGSIEALEMESGRLGRMECLISTVGGSKESLRSRMEEEGGGGENNRRGGEVDEGECGRESVGEELGLM
jgi:hypothetical protein